MGGKNPRDSIIKDTCEEIAFKELKGKTFIEITREDQLVTFIDSEYNEYFLLHTPQECCENVYLESVAGDLDDLLNVPILLAETASKHKRCKDGFVKKKHIYESYTYTFYKLATIKGYITMRWFGGSTGAYSEDVSLFRKKDLIN